MNYELRTPLNAIIRASRRGRPDTRGSRNNRRRSEEMQGGRPVQAPLCELLRVVVRGVTCIGWLSRHPISIGKIYRSVAGLLGRRRLSNFLLVVEYRPDQQWPHGLREEDLHMAVRKDQ